jgi:hypothetical protein
MEGERAQGRSTGAAAVFECGGEVDPGGGDAGDLLTGDGVVHGAPVVGGDVPFAANVVAEHG